MNMVEIATRVLVLLALIAAASGLTCLVCDGTSYDACEEQECKSSEVCQNVYSLVNGSATIRKQCMPRRACSSEESMSGNNCEENYEGDRSCKCCCDTDECNKPEVGCLYPKDCQKPAAPENGYVECPWRLRPRARCTFNCNDGYELDGNLATTCRRVSRDGTLGLVPNRVPTCVKKPEPGLTCMVCDESSNEACTETQECEESEVCQNDYRIVYGNVTITKKCQQKEACENEAAAVDNKCEESGGACKCCCDTDKCNMLKRGCIYPSDCAKPAAPENGYVTCPYRMQETAMCTFHCNAGYNLDGNADTTCSRAYENATLALEPNTIPKCVKEIPRCEGQFVAPENGKVKCKNAGEFSDMIESNYEGSKCKFRCDKHHNLSGKNRSKCKYIDGVLQWSNPPPRCVHKSCESDPSDPRCLFPEPVPEFKTEPDLGLP